MPHNNEHIKAYYLNYSNSRNDNQQSCEYPVCVSMDEINTDTNSLKIVMKSRPACTICQFGLDNTRNSDIIRKH